MESRFAPASIAPFGRDSVPVPFATRPLHSIRHLRRRNVHFTHSHAPNIFVRGPRTRGRDHRSDT